MKITIRPEQSTDFSEIDQLVLDSFAKGTEYSDGTLEVSLIHEIRAKEYYIPALSFVAERNGEIVGHCIFSRFGLCQQKEGIKDGMPLIETDLVLLAPVAVHYKHLRQGIGKRMLALAMEQVEKAGYRGIIVEGNPDFYGKLGFDPSYEKEILPSDQVQLPAPECLMIQELYDGALEGITGYVDFSLYETLQG